MDHAICDGMCNQLLKILDDLGQQKDTMMQFAESHKALVAENERLKNEITAMRNKIRTAVERGKFEREHFEEWLS